MTLPPTLRTWKKNPLFFVTAAASLALGIAALTTMASAMDALILHGD
jgi:hypothetical protein